MKRKFISSSESTELGDEEDEISSNFESESEDELVAEVMKKRKGMLLSDLFEEFANSNKTAQIGQDKFTNMEENYDTKEDDDSRCSEIDHGLEDYQNLEEDDEEDEEEDEETEEEEGDDEKHSNLLTSIQRFTDSESRRKQRELKDSFEDSALQGLSLDLLLGSESNQKIDTTPSKAPNFVDKTALVRNEREFTYESNKINMNKWHDAVLANRFNRSLDLAKDRRQFTRSRSLLQSFSPSTNFEKEMESITASHGLNEAGMYQNELDSLRGSPFSADELQQRQQDLARINALLFYEQMKRHRINKIKSKAFRKSLRRKAAKLSVEAEEQNNDDGDEHHRIEERASLKHKNTSNWAKMALKHAHMDQSLREAYHDAVRKGHELTKKIHSERNEESFDQSSGSLAATLEEMEQDQGGKLQQVEGKYSNLLKMEFMQRAIVKQREKLREEAVGAWVDDNLKVADISVAGKWDEKECHNYESRSKDSIHIEKSPVLTTSFDFHLQQSIVSKRDHQQRDNVVKPSLSGVQQDDLVALAFSGPNVEEEFQSLKEDAYDHEFGVEAKKLAVIKDVKAGWGDWAGPGSQAVSQRTLKRRDLALRQLENDRKLNSSTRRDFKKEGVIISEKRIKSAAKFKVGKVPFPFTSQEEYERSLQLPVGDEWNPSHVVKKITTAEVKTRPGRIILPINPLKA